ITLVLGLVFTWSQFSGWKALTEKGNFLVSKVLDNKGVYGEDYTIRFQGVPLIKEGEQFFHPEDVARIKPLNADLDEQRNTSSSFFFALTAAHLAHLVLGLLSLLVMVVMALKRRYTQADHAGLWSGVIYWHFLGVLWVYLLSFLVFVH
ncbi:MAG: cytochrome c oxidase subunit 3, partial [Flavobacteriales bacterium]